MAHKAPVQATCCETGAYYQQQNKERENNQLWTGLRLPGNYNETSASSFLKVGALIWENEKGNCYFYKHIFPSEDFECWGRIVGSLSVCQYSLAAVMSSPSNSQHTGTAVFWLVRADLLTQYWPLIGCCEVTANSRRTTLKASGSKKLGFVSRERGANGQKLSYGCRNLSRNFKACYYSLMLLMDCQKPLRYITWTYVLCLQKALSAKSTAA